MPETPLSIIVAYRRTKQAEDELQSKANQFASAFERMYAQVGSHVEEMALLCAQYGKANLESKLPAEVTVAVESVLAMLAQIWPALSDMPFPTMADQPIPPEPPVEG